MQSAFKLSLFPAKLHSLTNKYSHFLGLQKVTTFVRYPTIVAGDLGYLNKKTFLAPPYLTASQTPGLDSPLTNDMHKIIT